MVLGFFATALQTVGLGQGQLDPFVLGIEAMSGFEFAQGESDPTFLHVVHRQAVVRTSSLLVFRRLGRKVRIAITRAARKQ